MSTASQLDIKLWKADPRVTRAEIETQQFRALPGVNDCISTSHPWRGGGTTTNNTHKQSWPGCFRKLRSQHTTSEDVLVKQSFCPVRARKHFKKKYLKHDLCPQVEDFLQALSSWARVALLCSTGVNLPQHQHSYT